MQKICETGEFCRGQFRLDGTQKWMNFDPIMANRMADGLYVQGVTPYRKTRSGMAMFATEVVWSPTPQPAFVIWWSESYMREIAERVWSDWRTLAYDDSTFGFGQQATRL